MLTLTEIFTIIIIHYIADFILQTDKDAKGKSTSNKHLYSHTFTYAMTWFLLGTIWSMISNIYSNFTYLFDWWIVLKFSVITFLCHTIQDYITSREVKKYFDKQDYHNGFVVIGFDQVLHYVQLFLTYYFLKQ